MMFFSLVIYSLFRLSSSHIIEVECALESDPESAITTVTDSISTRYQYKWCTSVANEQIERWSLILNINEKAKNECVEYDVRTKVKAHSRLEEDMNKKFNCDRVCFSTKLDLIYQGCYTFSNELYKDKRTEYKNVQFIENNYTIENFLNKKTWYSSISNPNHLIVGIHNSHIPINDFELKLCNEAGCEVTEKNCSKISDGVSCIFPSGDSSVVLTHKEPWAYGDLFNSEKIISFELNKLISNETSLSPSNDWSKWRVSALSLSLLAIVLFTLFLWRLRVTKKKKDQLQNMWKNRSMSSNLMCNVPVQSPILIIHSKESVHALEAIKHLTKALQDNGAQVWDSQSARVLSAMSPNPIQWLRDELNRAKLILIQPYQLPDEKSPHYGDKLVNFVINTIQTSKVDFPYHKYYVASYSEIPCYELVPSVVPFRRYLLPEMVDQLVQTITNRPIRDEHKQLFVQAVNEHQKHLKHKYNLD